MESLILIKWRGSIVAAPLAEIKSLTSAKHCGALSLRGWGDAEDSGNAEHQDGEKKLESNAHAKPDDLRLSCHGGVAELRQGDEAIEIGQGQHDRDCGYFRDEHLAIRGPEELVERAGNAKARVGDPADDDQGNGDDR